MKKVVLKKSTKEDVEGSTEDGDEDAASAAADDNKTMTRLKLGVKIGKN